MIGGLARNETALKRLLILALLLSIAPFLILTLFSHPAFDDYTWAVLVLKDGFVHTQKFLYNTYVGRYFSTAVVSVGPLTFGSFAGYKAVGMLVIFLTALSIFCLVDALLKSSVGLVDKLLATSFLAALFSNQMPDVTEAYFWVTAAVVYQLPGILTLIFFALVINSSEKSKGVKVFLSFLSCLLIVAIVGSNETSMVVFALLVFVITIKAWIDKSDERRRWLVFSIVTTICSLIVILAPGNAGRSSYYPNRQRFFFSLGMSLLQEGRFLFMWLSNAAFALGTIFFIPVAAELLNKAVRLKHLRIHPLVSSLLLLTLVFLGFFPAYWSTGSMGQHRTVNTVYFLFLMGWFINIVIWVAYLKEKHGLTVPGLPKYVYAIGLPVLLSSLFLFNNTSTAIGDLVHRRAYRYDMETRKRDARFEQCAREGHIKDCPRQTIVDLPTTITNPYFETDFENERLFWVVRTGSSSSR